MSTPSNRRTLVLASGSPRRRELLRLLGFEFERVVGTIDETPQPDELPDAYTLRVSLEKAYDSVEMVINGAVILTADTTVADGNTILGKPENDAHAEAMLKQLRNRTHQVYTAITLLDTADNRVEQILAITQVTMRDYSDTEIAHYIASGDPKDKAGSYAIQNGNFRPVTRIKGCYANVMGLPLCHLVVCLRRFGVEPHTDIPAGCQRVNQIECPVYEDVLGMQ
ncbi:MAG: septum formation protein Maf [Chloroflexi bacterium]|nr:septum formation protein Maf [Chloroflexota bacterium]